jgi:two-component system KDP operon response regulator KdpE
VSSPRILVVEDESQLRFALVRYLQEHEYTVAGSEDGASALRAFGTFRPDVVLLDLMLPDTTGVDVCRQIRLSSQTPIIVLSALGDERTKVQALDEGADDYLTKPFAMEELLARIRVALRHGSSHRPSQPVISSGPVKIDLERRAVAVRGEAVHLTPTEYDLLKYLATNAGKIVTHPMTLRAVWGGNYSGDTAILRTFINQLRAKLEDDPERPKLILTEPRVGYRFVLDPED